MASKAMVDDFVAQRRIALVGASRSGRKFGNTVLRELQGKGYDVVPVHPGALDIDGVPCAPSLNALAEPVDGVVVIVPPAEAEKVVRDAVEAGIPRVWLQQGSGSEAALTLCRKHEVDVIDGECILMFAEPVRSIHAVHRWVWGVLRKLPA